MHVIDRPLRLGVPAGIDTLSLSRSRVRNVAVYVLVFALWHVADPLFFIRPRPQVPHSGPKAPLYMRSF